ncbi:MAG: hypothetical protein ACI4Q4_07875, partial [Oscillospiraceae bacterium]
MTAITEKAKRLGALLLALAVMLTTFSFAPSELRAVAEEYSFASAYTLCENAENYINITEKSLLLKARTEGGSNIDITDRGASDPVNLVDGDKLLFSFGWEWKSGVPLPVEGKSPCYYFDVSGAFAGIEFSDAEFPVYKDGVIAAKYKFVQEGEKTFLLININTETEADQQNRRGSCNFEASINLTAPGVDNGDGTSSLKFFDKTVVVKKTDSMPNVSVSKTAGTITKVGEDYWQNFTISLYNYGKTAAEDLVINDTVLSNSMFRMDTIEITSGNAVIVSLGSSLAVIALNDALYPTADPVNTWQHNPVEVTYRIKLDKTAAVSPESSKENKADVTYMNSSLQDDWSLHASARSDATVPSIKKGGVYSESEDKITWTLTLNVGEILKNESFVIDILIDEITYPNGTKETLTDLPDLTEISNWTDNGNGVYTYTYTTENISDKNNIVGASYFKNEATVSVDGNSYKADSGNIYTGTNSYDCLTKTGVSNGDGTFSWEISAEIPDELTGLYFVDDTGVGYGRYGKTNIDYSTFKAVIGGKEYTRVLEDG